MNKSNVKGDTTTHRCVPSKNNELFICTPENYADMTCFMQKESEHENNRLIYNLIDNEVCASMVDEEIMLEAPDWLLVKNKHFGSDLRYLIIFKDSCLKTIRDLRQKHVSVLKQAYFAVKYYLNKIGSHGYRFYFNYIPSVFQLHMHVNAAGPAMSGKFNDRIQPLHVVINNLEANTDHYANALILTKYCKTKYRAELSGKKMPTI